MSKGIRRKINAVMTFKRKEISAFASQGKIAGGLASEGYNGGYLDALEDVMLALDGVEPQRWRWVKGLKKDSHEKNS